jgi:hypothetical protein
MEAVDFVNKKNVASLEISENASEIARFFDLGAGGGVKVRANGGGNDVGEGCFSKPRGAGEENVFKDIITPLSGGNHEHETLSDFILSVKVLESGGA